MKTSSKQARNLRSGDMITLTGADLASIDYTWTSPDGRETTITFDNGAKLTVGSRTRFTPRAI